MSDKDFNIFVDDLTADAVDAYLQGSLLAVDTETMGLLPRRDRLCLVQMCDRAGHISLVRFHRGVKQAPQLRRLFEATSLRKVFHYARFDMAMLQYHLDISVRPVFCTKIASKLVRTYTQRHGLKDLIAELVGAELNKSAQSSDWGAALELSEEQLRYASNDVRFLLAACDKLTDMLKREERLQLSESCFAHLETLVQLDLLGYESLFEH
ncbi:MAG: ribonuclease D [Gemmatimonadaceae bacterium]|nr:ribonuclease D [Gloeobacterales cyanobacterium ES-bin-141]